MKRTSLVLAASLAALIAATPALRAEDGVVPSAADIAGGLANPVELPTVAPEIEAPKAAEVAPVAPLLAAPAEPVKALEPAKPVEVVVDPAVAAHAAVVAALDAAAGKLDVAKGTTEEKRERAAMAAFYKARLGEPLFVTGSGLSPAGKAVAAQLAAAATDGLKPADYALDPMKDDAEGLAAAELDIAATALRYARHLQSGRFAPTRVSDLVTPKLDVPDPAKVLAALAGSKDIAATLEAYAPPHEGYKRLKARLAAMRVNPEPPPPPQVMVPAGASLKPGATDARIIQLRQRLDVPAAEGADPEVYDQTLVDQVRLFQKERNLGTSGLVGPATLAALNAKETPKIATEADVVVNMERWRWLPRDLGSMNVFVNIPGFYLDVNRNGQSIHRTRVIVGRTANATPVFSDTMSYIIVNPYWNVPVSIVKKEMMSQIQASGGAYLDRGNYEVLVNDRVVASNQVDWANVNPASVLIRQRPGGGNALGNVKFMFPNQHSVYLHDTSSRSLFSQDYRSLSHGCVRVFEPFTFADKLLIEEPDGLNGSKLKAMIGGPEKQINMKRKVSVHLSYFTTKVLDDGKLEFNRDLYGYDARMKQILGL